MTSQSTSWVFVKSWAKNGLYKGPTCHIVRHSFGYQEFYGLTLAAVDMNYVDIIICIIPRCMEMVIIASGIFVLFRVGNGLGTNNHRHVI